jgi:two-component sensor histidine kinase
MVLCGNARGQEDEKDSLIAVISRAVHDSSLADAYTRLAIIHYENDPEQSVRYGMKALEKSEKLGARIRIARTCQAIGVAYDYGGNLDSCLYFLNRAIAICRDEKLPDKESHMVSDIALAHYLRGNYELALRNHLEALRLRQQFGDKRFIAISYNNIGLVYRSRKDFQNAIRYYKESLAIKEEMGDEKGILNTLINIGSAYQSNSQFDSALAFAQRAWERAFSLHLDNDILAAESNMAAAMVNLGRLDDAFPLLASVEKKAVAAGDKKSLLTIYETLGDAWKRRERLAEAQNIYLKGLDLASGNKRREYMEVFMRKLSATAYASGNYKMAWEYADRGRLLRDSLWNEENSRQINEMSAVYESAEKEKQIETLNSQNKISLAEARARKRERNYFILSSFLLLAASAVAYMGYASNRKKKNMLNRQNAIIEQQLREKEFLVKEIHHRVKNNLQVISSLLSLQSRYITDEQALDAVRESRNRVHSMSMIHQNLYQEENLAGIEMKDYITRLCENLFQSYNISPSRVNLETDIDPVVMDVDLVVPMGLILNELVTNSLKYAFPGNRGGTIRILLKYTGNEFRLLVQDDGIGFPGETLPTKDASMGARLIRAFVQKLKGDMKAYNKQGAVVEIHFQQPGIEKS